MNSVSTQLAPLVNSETDHSQYEAVRPPLTIRTRGIYYDIE